MLDRLSHYEILRKAGEGGMGEVYVARDASLGRMVALKVLPREVASDSRRLRRFQQEARAASRLNHPNVTQVYEISSEGETHFIVMEYVEGETLEARIHQAAQRPEDVLHVAIETAKALQAAHREGIIHRDIKPANIMITPSAQVKVLDFGLAKTLAPDEDGSQEGPSITQTQSGVVLGTVHYMSPEQAMGEPVDHRSDIFSLGVVLYEMVFGRRPFSGPNPQAVLHQVFSVEPQSSLPPGSAFPGEMEFIIAKCLRKAPAERYQSITDLIADLSVIQRRVTGEGSGKVTLGEREYNLPRQTARILFIVLQCLYLIFYVCALRWNPGMDLGLNAILGGVAGHAAFLLLLVTAPVGIAVRLYLISTVMLDHVSTGVRYRKAFPVYFLLDILWSLSPFGLAPKIGEWMALACVPPLVFSPFAQRTLIRSAYDLYAPRRFSTAP